MDACFWLQRQIADSGFHSRLEFSAKRLSAFCLLPFQYFRFNHASGTGIIQIFIDRLSADNMAD